jgi:hypothetical protein
MLSPEPVSGLPGRVFTNIKMVVKTIAVQLDAKERRSRFSDRLTTTEQLKRRS